MLLRLESRRFQVDDTKHDRKRRKCSNHLHVYFKLAMNAIRNVFISQVENSDLTYAIFVIRKTLRHNLVPEGKDLVSHQKAMP